MNNLNISHPSTYRRLQEVLRAQLKAAGKPQPEVPSVPQLWGDMPHPLAWSLGSATGGMRHPTAADLLEVSRKVRADGAGLCC